MLKRLAGSLALFSLVAVPAIAKEGIAQLAFFKGDWHCTGKLWYCASASGCATTGTTHIEEAIGGDWLHVTGDETMAGPAPEKFNFALYFGYDPRRKSYVAVGAASGGIYGTQYSKGWDGDTFVLSADKYLARDTFIRNGPGEFTHVAHAPGKGKTWKKVQEEVCRKAGG